MKAGLRGPGLTASLPAPRPEPASPLRAVAALRVGPLDPVHIVRGKLQGLCGVCMKRAGLVGCSAPLFGRDNPHTLSKPGTVPMPGTQHASG